MQGVVLLRGPLRVDRAEILPQPGHVRRVGPFLRAQEQLGGIDGLAAGADDASPLPGGQLRAVLPGEGVDRPEIRDALPFPVPEGEDHGPLAHVAVHPAKADLAPVVGQDKIPAVGIIVVGGGDDGALAPAVVAVPVQHPVDRLPLGGQDPGNGDQIAPVSRQVLKSRRISIRRLFLILSNDIIIAQKQPHKNI